MVDRVQVCDPGFQSHVLGGTRLPSPWHAAVHSEGTSNAREREGGQSEEKLPLFVRILPK